VPLRSVATDVGGRLSATASRLVDASGDIFRLDHRDDLRADAVR
jgi:hypothetical protein